MDNQDGEDIKVNRRKDDKIHFESPFIQSISDGIDYLRGEAKDILNELDSCEFKQNIDEFDVEEACESTIDQFSDVVDELARVKSKVIDSDDLPDFVKDSTINAKRALNSDIDYVRRAERRLNRANEDDELVGQYKYNIRVIELCDKAIEVNNQNPKAYYLKGLAFINLAKYDEAIEEFISSLALDDNADVWLAVGKANRLNKEYNDALSIYDSILDRDENSFDALLGKAMTYYDWDKYGQADIFFKKASAIEDLDDEYASIWDECLNNN